MTPTGVAAVVAHYVAERARLSAEPITLRVLEVGTGTVGAICSLDSRVDTGSGAVERLFLPADISLDRRIRELPVDSLDLIALPGGVPAVSAARAPLRWFKALLHCNGVLVIDLGETRPAAAEALRAELAHEGFAVAEIQNNDCSLLLAESDGRIWEGAGEIATDAAEGPSANPGPAQRPDGAVEDQLQDALIALLADTLQFPLAHVDPERAFADFGVDSILGANLLKQIEMELGVALERTALHEYNCVRSLAAHIVQDHAAALAAAPTPEDQLSAPATAMAAPRTGTAVIGLSCRFAKSENPRQFWAHLAAGHDLVAPVTRWDVVLPGAAARSWFGALIDDIDLFDAGFFNISGREAECMDPQQRLVLMESWRALEDAGYAGDAIRGSACGLYVGCIAGDYAEQVADDEDRPAQMLWGNAAAITPVRLAYWLDLHGPAVAIDTACSSALVAVHFACQGLANGDADLALAGGVHLYSGPGFYLSAGKAGMLSASGRCHTFDAQADGFVPGEGVGFVVLKRLAEAIRDGDHIYGVIRATGINQDGATNGITAPSREAQEALERHVYDGAGIDPAHIQMVEAHGTGTVLGDPIEVKALTRAFRHHTDKVGYCALGSVKTNIGHTAVAAGIAGLTKVLLALQHRQLPPSLHYSRCNPNIDFDNSPFFVCTELMDWPVNRRVDGREIPRCAALSSFGFSGTNAHMVIEAAPVTVRVPPGRPLHLVVLSGRSEERLREQVVQLRDMLCEAELPALGNLSYTLLVGRRHFAHRLACLAADIQELREILEAWLQGRPSASLLSGKVDRRRRPGNVTPRAMAADAPARLWRAEIERLAGAWLQGDSLLLAAWFPPGDFSRVPLPTYPFARDRHWITPSVAVQRAIQSESVLAHPFGNGASIRFEGTEGIFAHHLVQGQRVLPAVVYLELARLALQRELGAQASAAEIANVVWKAPLAAGRREQAQAVRVRTRLSADGGGGYRFEIESTVARDSEEPGTWTSHAQGRARPQADTPGPILDLAAIRVRCAERFACERLYEMYAALGLEYGPTFRAVRELLVGRDEVLVQLEVNADADRQLEACGIHPGLLDGAQQAALVLRRNASDGGGAALPFTLAALRIYRACTNRLWGWVRLGAGGSLDIDLCDESGQVVLQARGFSARSLPQPAALETLLLEPVWKPRVTEPVRQSWAHRVVVFVDLPAATAADIREKLPAVECIQLAAESADLAQRYEQQALALSEVIREQASGSSKGPVRLQVVAGRPPDDEEWVPALGLSAVLRTARLEHSHLIGQLLSVDPALGADTLRDYIEQERDCPQDEVVSLRRGERRVRDWRELAETAPRAPWRDGAVYLISGGSGGLGLIVADAISQDCRDCSLVLVGRSTLEGSRLEAVERLRGRACVSYHSLDVTDPVAMAALVQQIAREHGGPHGVIHSAGVLSDSYLRTKTQAEWQRVLAPKVAGTLALDRATEAAPLEFFLMFSSLAGWMGNPAQADYAAANGFLDQYVQRRNRRVARGLAQGRTLVLDWPLWADGGMRVDAATAALMHQSVGMTPMSSHSGVLALKRAWASEKPQVLVIEGEGTRLRQRLLQGAAHAPAVVAAAADAPVDSAALQRKLVSYLLGDVSEALRVKSEELDADAQLSEYGFDSISLTEFANRLNAAFDLDLMPTVFFEFPTVQALAEHLVQRHGQLFARRFGSPARVATAATPPATAGVPTDTIAQSAPIVPEVPEASARPARARDPIAIIGMSGRFPMADDLDEFWSALSEERDCIQEILPSRWDWREYFGDPRTQPNKTHVKWGGFINGIEEFDPEFFGISAREAVAMDPQQRLLMLHAWRAIEDAGYAPSSLAGTQTGIFVGTANSGYGELLAQVNAAIEGFSSTGAVPSLGPNRMSFFLDLHGPSEPVETACSSSLVAIHRAIQAMDGGSCDLAIVGGVQTIVTPLMHISFSRAGMLSGDGRCKSFSDRADGYGRGEGIGMVLLKRLSAAQAAADHIYGVILASAENHGGRANSLTAPNPKAQAALLEAAYRRAGIDVRTVSYIEAHGTGTELGDPVEVNALKAAFAQLYKERGAAAPAQPHCGLGTVKSNIGHLEMAAGIAGLIKVLLQLKHRTLVKSLHCERVNPYIELAGTPFYIVQQRQPWPAQKDAGGRELPRRAGVSSFGFGGANAHVVIEEYLDTRPRVEADGPCALILSARTSERLVAQARALLAVLPRYRETDLPDIAYTLQVGRDAMSHRVAVTAASVADLQDRLQAFIDGRADFGGFRGEVRRGGMGSALEILAADDALSSLVERWWAEGQFDKVLAWWVHGGFVPWTQLYGTQRPRRISLPGYAFAPERYWISLPAEAASTPATEAAGTPATETTPSTPATEALCWLSPQWLPAPSQSQSQSPLPESHHVILIDSDVSAFETWRGGAPAKVTLDHIEMGHDAAGAANTVLEVLERLRELFRAGRRGVLTQIVLRTAEEHEALATSLGALAKSACQEQPGARVQLQWVDPNLPAEVVWARLLADVGDPAAEIRHTFNARSVRGFQEVSPALHPELPWKEGGRYLITGGAGGIGLRLVRALVKRLARVELMLVGRSPPDARLEAMLQGLRRDGVRIEYRSAAVDDAVAMAGVFERLKESGGLNGIVHAAGVLRDGLIANKSREAAAAVLSPKLNGTEVLDRLSRGMSLDFFVLFSSIASVFGNAGQADYAAANGFLDGFAAERARRAGSGRGHTLSIGWPLWRDGGMRGTPGSEARWRDDVGLAPLESEQAFQALEAALAFARKSDVSQLVVLHGHVDRMRRTLLPAVTGSAALPVDAAPAAGAASDEALRASVELRLRAMLARFTGFAIDRLDATEPLESYGIDSVMVTRLNEALGEVFGPLPRTLLFEYQSLRELAGYLIVHHIPACRAWCGYTLAAASALSTAHRPRAAEPTVTSAPVPVSPKPVVTSGPEHTGAREPIAIIGLSGRYPQAPDLSSFWDVLAGGRDCITEVPAGRWGLQGWYEADVERAVSGGRSYSRWGGFLEGFAQFDAPFFKLSAREAYSMDPQERVFIESCWSTLEDAGYSRERLARQHQNRVGVFAGITKTGYERYADALQDRGERLTPYTSFGSVANRVSYLLNLNGPSLPIDTMCSASLTAVHAACESLRHQECELALAGGVNLYLHPSNYVMLCAQRMLSPSGRCRSFGAGGDGFVPGEGVGSVLLKPLSAAQRDGDAIRAVILGSAINHGGKTNGYTVPNPVAQAQLIRTALRRAGISAREVSYIEAHGTGTSLGDPIEMAGLAQAFAADTPASGFCALGSIKSNIGHLEAAAGIAALTKVVLQLEHAALVPTLHAGQLNPNIDLVGTPFVLQKTLERWMPPRRPDGSEAPRIAGISSFGAGGANAHVVLQEYLAPQVTRESAGGPHLFVLSARTPEQLQAQLTQWIEALPGLADCDLGDIAYTLQVGREAMEERLGLCVESHESLLAALRALRDCEPVDAAYRGQARAHRTAMALFDSDDDLRAAIDRWLVKGKYGKLLELWVQGLELDWNLLHRGARPRLLHLPTYPFAREQYWVADLAGQPTPADDGSADEGVMYLAPSWQPLNLETHAGSVPPLWILRCALPDAQLASVRWPAGAQLLDIAAAESASETRFEAILREVVGALTVVLQRSEPLSVCLVVSEEEVGLGQGLTALMDSLHRENPAVLAQTVVLGRHWQPEHLTQLLEHPQRASLLHLRDGQVCQRVWNELLVSRPPETPWRNDASYLISGGAGGLGLAFAQEIVAHAPQARVVLVGRSPPAGVEARLGASLRARIEYRSLDITNREAVAQLVAELATGQKPLRGILHAAGVLRDGYFLRKQRADWEQVLAPKVRGALALDAASSALELDFFVLFSSLAAVAGSAGQADYAAANAFLDSLAARRAQQAVSGERHGVSLSINWPLWADGGMRGEAIVIAQAERLLGLRPLGTAEGVAALGMALACGASQVAVLSGDRARLRKAWLGAPSAAPARSNARAVEVRQVDEVLDTRPLERRVLQLLQAVFSQVTLLPANRLDQDEPFESYGIESVAVMRLNAEFEQVFGPLSKTLLYEHRTLAGLARYFASRHHEASARWCGWEERATVALQSGPSLARTAVASAMSSLPAAREGIAIIGMSGSYPGAADLEQFWENLRAGRDCVREDNSARWPQPPPIERDVEMAVTKAAVYTTAGAFVEGFAEFDPLFFGISRREAFSMDPQERLFLQSCWKTLEDAGYTRARLAAQHGSRVGVFAGITKTGYEHHGQALGTHGEPLNPRTSFSSVANRVSYVLDLKGPSLPIDTMCSSSLTAIHEACEHLYRGECELALAGGVNLYLHPSNYVVLCAQRMLSPSGRCRSFGAHADGFVPGEGVGTVLLKRLSAAERDGDRIEATIRGTAISHGGKTNGYTVPDPLAQAQLIRRALDGAQINARAVSYLEAHGTGTRLGDPIEISGLAQAFESDTRDTSFCALGSLKSNIGHLEAAAGVAALTKVVLQLRHGELVPTLHADTANPNIDFERSPFVLQTALAPWRRQQLEGAGEIPRLAGISSFGAGGSNAHVLVEEYVAAPAQIDSQSGPHLIVLSARNSERLIEQARQLLGVLPRFTPEALGAMAYTLQTGREAMEERLAFRAHSLDELETNLRAWLDGDLPEGVYRGQVPRQRAALEVLDQDGDLHAVIMAWLASGKHHKLLELWVAGLSFDWASLYTRTHPRPVSLPTYPFARETFWVAHTNGAAVPAYSGSGASQPENSGIGPQCLALCWGHADPFASTRPDPEEANAPARSSRVLLIGDDPAARNALARSGARVQAITPTPGYTIRSLADELRAVDPFDRMVWALPEHASGGFDLDAIAAAQDHGVRLGLRLVRALLEAGYGERALDWTVVTYRTYPVDDAPIDPTHAGVHGLIGTLAKEHPNWSIRLLDLGSATDWECGDPLRVPPDPRGHSWGCRNGSWRRLQLVRIDSPPPTGQAYRSGGVYVVIGGAGHVGTTWTEHVLQQCGAQVVWLGRRALDSRIRAQIERLARLGPAPVYRQVDACDPVALQCSLAEIEQRLGALHGVIDSAMVLTPVSLAQMDSTQLDAAVDAKLGVALSLAHACRGRRLDFLLFFSSLVTVIRNPGQAHYAAGCVLADAFAHTLRHRPDMPPVKVMNWGFWDRPEHDAGGLTQELARVGIGLIHGREGMVALDALLLWPIAQMGFMSLTKRVLVEGMAPGLSAHIDADGIRVRARPSAIPSSPAEVPVKAGADPSIELLWDSAIRRHLAAVLVLRPEEIDADRAFAEYGLDSVNGTRFVSLLADELGVTLDPTVIFDYATVNELAGHLALTRSGVLRAPRRLTAAVQSTPTSTPAPRDEGIAVVGMAGRFAQSATVDDLWKHLAAGHDLVGPIRRWDLSALPGKRAASVCASQLEAIDEFDPLFFNISGLEAQYMDPNQRLFLQTCWHALEHAGHLDDEALQRRVGVYVGVEKGDYERLIEADPPAQAMLGNTHSILAARVAYVLNLQGPALAIDTACSSSLVAVHLGCQALRNGEIDLAICGGTAVEATPLSLMGMAGAGMLSPRGRCHTFDERADGFVPGEAVGVVVLRRMPDALSGHDTVYGVIRGSAINQDGATNGITAPSARSQERLQSEVYARFKIDPAQIGYVEAHGTGTALGDPIEVNALCRSFRRHTDRVGYCALGSLKTNLGHAKAAAGIAALIKVLLCLKHRQLPPSLHFERCNPKIAFDGSPFFVNTTLRAWPAPGADLPRLAAINSFGMSGTNAHVVVEEAPPSQQTASPPGCCLMVLSARTGNQLRQQVEQHLRWLDEASAVRCVDVSATLLLGRRHFAHRAAWVCSDLGNWRDAMRGWLQESSRAGESGVPLVDRGELQSTTQQAEALLERAVQSTARQDEYPALLRQLASLYRQGATVAFTRLFTPFGAQRVALPGYPFARDRYWVPMRERSRKGLHPLLQEDTSDLLKRRFEVRFNGDERLLAEHVVAGKRVFPGAAYLEMVLAAMQASAGDTQAATPLRLTHTTWVRPFAYDEQGTTRLQIELLPQTPHEARFEVRDPAAAADTMPFCQGTVRRMSLTAPAPMQIPSAGAERISREQFYARFGASGVEYGPSFRAIEEILIEPGAVLARLRLPESASREPHWMLHPSLLDSALQAAQVLYARAGAGASNVPSLPFALDLLDVFGTCAAECWARIVFAPPVSADASSRLDVDLFAADGRVLASLRGFSSRPLAQRPTGDEHYRLLPVWEALPATAFEGAPAWPRHLLVLGSGAIQLDAVRSAGLQAHDGTAHRDPRTAEIEDFVEVLRDAGEFDHVVWIAPSAAADTDSPAAGVLALFRLIKALLTTGVGARALALTVITVNASCVDGSESLAPEHAAAHGLMGSLAKEYPHWQVRVLDLPAMEQWPDALFARVPANPFGNVLAWRAGEWFAERLLPLQSRGVSEDGSTSPYRQRGLYVVIGGAGGVGRTWSEWMIRRYDARIVWIGRRPIDNEIRSNIERLAAIGSRPVYLSADATDPVLLARAAVQVHALGPVHGVIHSAIVLGDAALARMDEPRFVRALESKLLVSRNLARVFASEALDFVLFFSSLQSFTKAAGQSNYASGCTYKDTFAREMARNWHCAVKIVNWGYWGETGIVADEVHRLRMERLGLGSIDPDQAMETVEWLLRSPHPQAVFFRATRPELLSAFGADECVFRAARSVTAAERHVPPSDRAPPLQSWRRALDEALARVLFEQLQRFAQEQGCAFSHHALRESVAPMYRRWVDESVHVLSEHALWRNDARSAGQAPADNDAWSAWEAARNAFSAEPGAAASLKLLDTTLRELPAILSGRRRATDVMFHGSSSVQLVEGVYQGNQTADYYNSVLADVLVAYLQSRPAIERRSATLRILEIGAGTGATSAVILQRLHPFREQVAEYRYTDISRAFLLHAQEHFSPGHPYLTTALFNVEQALAPQGIETGAYDVVVATNVLHATSNVRQAVRNAKAALKSNGLLLLNEISDRTLFTHLTFGLLEGWWRFEDPALRIAGSPALTPASWRRVLQGEGFTDVQFPAEAGHAQGQQVIVARSDGLIRQPVTGTATPVASQPASAAQSTPPAQQAHGPAPTAPTRSTPYFERARDFVRDLIARTIRVPTHEIDPTTPFERYGIDSILVVRLTNALTDVLGSVSSTLFFEYQTVHALTEYLLEKHGDALQMAVDGLSGRSTSSQPQHVLPVAREAAVVVPVTREGARDIAIIGLSGRYPQAPDVDQFWANLAAGRNCISEVPGERWDWREFFDPKSPGGIYTRWGGFIEGMECFDAAFFQISPREAETLDPQERIFMEEAFRCIEDAGYTPQDLAPGRRVGVFAGVMNAGYPSGAAYFSIANRVSFTLDLRGPSLAVDTACSSSLTAIHLAVESLRNGSCDCALAGGVNLIVTPVHFLKLTAKRMLSHDDRCKAFGADADGFVDGEGVGVLLLKPLAQSLRDGDHIYGVIRGTAINAGGKTNGYTVPNPVAQADVVRCALADAGVEVAQVSYIEAHGTGTDLGDPIEIAGLNRAFGAAREPRCAIGSVKTNIGHCESAAGIAGVTKVLLQMRHGLLAPSLHSSELNPKIDFAASVFVVNHELRPWLRQTPDQPRIAGVSSFGAGGANAHVVIEDYVAPVSAEPAPVPCTQALVLSARTPAQLRERASQLLRWLSLEEVREADLPHVAYTLQVGRMAMERRMGLLVDSVGQAKARLAAYLSGELDPAWCLLAKGPAPRGEQPLPEEIRNRVEQGLREGALHDLLELWVQGHAVDWAQLTRQGLPRRLRMPAYPFERRRYWWRWAQPGGARAGHTVVAASPAPSSSTPVSNDSDEGLTVNEKPRVRLSEDTAPDVTTPPAATPSVSPSASPTTPPANYLPPAVAPAGNVPVVVHSRSQLRTEMVASFASVLFMEPAEVDETRLVGEMGMDSVLAVDWVRELNARYGLSLEALEIYDHPTVLDMIQLVSERLNLAATDHAAAADAKADAALEPRPPLSVEQILQQVRDGTLPIDEAERLLGG